MIALDTNILVYLLVSSQPEHFRAKAWLAQNEDALVITHTNVGEVLRLLTHPRVFSHPLDLRKAIRLLKQFIENFSVVILSDDDEWWQSLSSLIETNPGIRGNEIFDARIALCLRYHGVQRICTLDSDFVKYRFLKVIKI